MAQGYAIEMTEHAESERSEAKNQPLDRKMGGQKLEIGLASALLIVPMLTLAALLIGLVYKYRMPDQLSSYSLDNKTALPLGSAYYVNYSSTTLVYIASLSSTLSTLLIPAAMLLYSFKLGNDLAKDSDQAAVSNLPSPFQLDMLIKMVEGRLMVLWTYIRYVSGSKRRRISIVPSLQHASIVLLALAVLAVLVNLADLWLHLGTRSVLYLELRPEEPSQAFAPGRGFNSTCLSHPAGAQYGHYYVPISCMIHEVLHGPEFLNETEFFRTAANTSNVSRVYLSDGHAVLGPAKIPLDFDFQATSFGSQTSCQAVTGLCGANSTDEYAIPNLSDFNFACNDTVAGLNMTGNFLNVLAPLNESSGLSSGPAVTNDTQDKEIEPGQVVLGGNTIVGNRFSIGFQYFNDAQRLAQTPYLDPAYGSGDDRRQLYWALVWWAPFTTGLTDGNTSLGINDTEASGKPVTNETAAVGVFNDLDDMEVTPVQGFSGGSFGILSCETNISEVNYSFTDGTMGITSLRVPRTNASIPFVTGITAQWGYDQIHAGLQQSFAAATLSENFAARVATIYDQILVSIPAGVMLPLPFLNASRRVETPVTRVPKAPLLAVLLFDLLYVATGIALTISTLAASARGHGVRDVQARLNLTAVVAEGFEDARLGDDAVDVEELFAERRGLVTKRVAFRRRDGGGRCYRKVDDNNEEREEDERRLL